MIYPPGTRRRRTTYVRALQRRKITLALLLACVLLLFVVFAVSAKVESWPSGSHVTASLTGDALTGDDLGDITVDGHDVNSLPAPDRAAGAVDPKQLSKANPKAKNSKKGRLVYRYSVVPGGVQTPAELAEAAAHDPDVALHYSRLNFRRAHLVRLLASRRMYISYRKGGRILWSTKPHLIRAGETVITDGKVTARTRCGNRLSSKPKGITEADEPTEAQLNRPAAVEGEPEQPPITGFSSTLEPPLVANGGLPVGPLGEPVWRTPFFGGGGGTGGKCKIDPQTHKCKKKHHSPPPVPEPGTLVLVGSGIVAMSRRYWMGWWRS